MQRDGIQKVLMRALRLWYFGGLEPSKGKNRECEL